MRLILNEPIQPKEVKREDVIADVYYDRHQKLWCVSLKDKNTGYTISDYQYGRSKKEAITLKNEMLSEIDYWVNDTYDLVEDLELSNEYDSEGNPLTKEQINFFRNSKVRDNQGDLLVCYHGSPNAGFREFNPRDNKSQFGKYKFGNANVNYFTTDKKSASTYTDMGYDDGTIYQVYLNITNPYVVDNKSEAEIKSHLNIKDDRLRQRQVELFDKIFRKWEGKILDYSDYRFNELNNDLAKLNLELRPSDCYDEDTDPMDIDYFDLWDLGRNSFMGAEHILEYQYSTDELFDEDMYDQLKEDIIGDDINDYYFSTDDIVRFVLSLDEGYDGIIIKDIHDSKDMFSGITTDYITLGSSNQIKAIDNYNPTSSNNIDETLLLEIYPKKGESKRDFLQRFMSELVDEYPDEKQRYAVANSYWERRHKNETFHIDYETMFKGPRLAESTEKVYYIPQEYKDLLINDAKRYGWLDGDYSYEFKVLSLDKIMEANKLKNNPDHGMFYRRTNIWGDEPSEYHYAPSKEDWLYSPIRVRGDYRIIDGGHRLYALYNDGYDYAEVLVPKGSIFESLLTEASRNDLISKAKRGKEYKDKSKGRNRWERKKYSKVASTTREYNSIDMNAFFKKDILTINIPIRGETDNYTVRIKFGGALKEIQNTVKRNNNRLDYKSISQALVRCFNGENVYVRCSCEDFTYRFNYWAEKNGFSADTKREVAPYENQFEWTNKYDDMGGICKHIALVISNTFWLMKVASVINNYIHYAETYMQRQFADIIFPKVYGVKYPDAVQLGLFDRQYLKHSKGVIDEINQYGKTRNRFKKKPIEKEDEVEIRTSPKQLSIFDAEKEENRNPSFKKQTIFDYDVEDTEEVEEKPTSKPTFKPVSSNQPTINKGYKKLSLFDEEEED